MDQLIEVRLNERTMSSLSLDPEEMDEVYAALRKAFRIAYSGQYTVWYPMKAGDALVFDNLRVLHGRSAFNAERLIRQTNVIRDEFYARHAFLAEKLHTI
jgi:gamma-butyrobetaine dioxygenase/trimethyllysine dioxygenase